MGPPSRRPANIRSSGNAALGRFDVGLAINGGLAFDGEPRFVFGLRSGNGGATFEHSHGAFERLSGDFHPDPGQSF